MLYQNPEIELLKDREYALEYLRCIIREERTFIRNAAWEGWDTSYARRCIPAIIELGVSLKAAQSSGEIVSACRRALKEIQTGSNANKVRLLCLGQCNYDLYSMD